MENDTLFRGASAARTLRLAKVRETSIPISAQRDRRCSYGIDAVDQYTGHFGHKSAPRGADPPRPATTQAKPILAREQRGNDMQALVWQHKRHEPRRPETRQVLLPELDGFFRSLNRRGIRELDTRLNAKLTTTNREITAKCQETKAQMDGLGVFHPNANAQRVHTQLLVELQRTNVRGLEDECLRDMQKQDKYRSRKRIESAVSEWELSLETGVAERTPRTPTARTPPPSTARPTTTVVQSPNSRRTSRDEEPPPESVLERLGGVTPVTISRIDETPQGGSLMPAMTTHHAALHGGHHPRHVAPLSAFAPTRSAGSSTSPSRVGTAAEDEHFANFNRTHLRSTAQEPPRFMRQAGKQGLKPRTPVLQSYFASGRGPHDPSPLIGRDVTSPMALAAKEFHNVFLQANTADEDPLGLDNAQADETEADGDQEEQSLGDESAQTSTSASSCRTGLSGQSIRAGMRPQRRQTLRAADGLDVMTMQPRLNAVWFKLEMPMTHKLEMLQKYASLELASELHAALATWEQAASLIPLRERAVQMLHRVRSLESFEQDDLFSDEQRHQLHEAGCWVIPPEKVVHEATPLPSRAASPSSRSGSPRLPLQTSPLESLAEPAAPSTADEEAAENARRFEAYLRQVHGGLTKRLIEVCERAEADFGDVITYKGQAYLPALLRPIPPPPS